MDLYTKAARVAQVLEHHYSGMLKASGVSLTTAIADSWSIQTVTTQAAQSAGYLDDIVVQAGSSHSFKTPSIGLAAKAYVTSLVFGDIYAAIENVVRPEFQENFEPNTFFTIDLIRALATDDVLYA